MRRYPSAKDLAKIAKSGRYAVGHGAYLQIAAGGTRSWLFRYRVGDRQHHMGLGSCDYVTLAEARERAIDAQRLRIRGGDPLEAKRSARRQRMAAHMKSTTFKQCAMAYIAAHEPSWRGNRSRVQWTQSLQKHVFPHIGALPVSDIDTPRLLSVLEPIWTQVPETARRVRNRIELILEYATAHGMRTGDNPARWRGLLENLLPDQSKANGRKHLPAMPWRELPAFMRKLRAAPENAARALELGILCASRPGEVLGARWCEIDLEARTWIIPPERMKGHREHRMPLSRRTVELLASLPQVGEHVFVGRGDARPSAHMLVRVLRGMGYAKLTAHGFRSAFRDWAAEQTQYPNHVVEQALAHSIGGAVERAYRRTDLLDQRRRLMQDWADFCDCPEGAHE
jgi:integrase